jgi:single-stranded-DNA-specific exonuclease
MQTKQVSDKQNPILKSILKQNWQQKPFDERLALTISQKCDTSDVLAKSLAIKNIQLDEVDAFLNPAIKTSLPNPFDLLDMDKAANQIINAIKNNKQITVFGDYDVDGATSSSLLKRFIDQVGGNCNIYIPDRILEGYGPNSKALIELKNKGTDLVITVDCGTTAFAPLEDAHKAGLDVIVIDHHLGALEKPKALAVVNPNRLDETFPHKNLAAVGVCFLLIVAVNKLLREDGYFQKHNITEPKLLGFLDLVALGTVCDVVSLQGINRAFVAQGLKVIQSRSNLGIRNLCDIANLSEPCSAYHLGFVIGPRINAGGRIGKSDLGARLLSSNNEEEVKKIAADLDMFNRQRKDVEAKVLEEALAQVKKNKGEKEPVIFAASKGWHPGVIGIVASRIKEKYSKPTAIIAIDNGIGKASCRSINGVDFGSSIIEARTKGIINEGGGHAMAAGFSVDENKIEELHQFLCSQLESDVAKSNENNVFHFHSALDSTSTNMRLVKEITKLEPYGAGNSKPKFLIENLQIVEASLIGKDKNHVRCIFSNKELTGWKNRIQSVCFKAMESEIGPILISKNKGKPVSVIGTLNINHWMGNQNLQVLIEDIIPTN